MHIAIYSNMYADFASYRLFSLYLFFHRQSAVGKPKF